VSLFYSRGNIALLTNVESHDTVLLTRDTLLSCTALEFIHLEQRKLYKIHFAGKYWDSRILKGNSFNAKLFFFYSEIVSSFFFFDDHNIPFVSKEAFLIDEFYCSFSLNSLTQQKKK